MLESAMGLIEVREYDKFSVFSWIFENAPFIKNTKRLGEKKAIVALLHRYESIRLRLEKERGRDRIGWKRWKQLVLFQTKAAALSS